MQIGNYIITTASRLRRILTRRTEDLENGYGTPQIKTFCQIIGNYESRLFGICIYRADRTTKFVNDIKERYFDACDEYDKPKSNTNGN